MQVKRGRTLLEQSGQFIAAQGENTVETFRQRKSRLLSPESSQLFRAQIRDRLKERARHLNIMGTPLTGRYWSYFALGYNNLG